MHDYNSSIDNFFESEEHVRRSISKEIRKFKRFLDKKMVQETLLANI